MLSIHKCQGGYFTACHKLFNNDLVPRGAELLIDHQLGDAGSNFLRLGRGLIINQDFVYSIDVAKQRLILSDCIGCYHELSASREVLTKLKAYIDVMVKNG